VANEFDKLGPKDFITGCLVIIVALFMIPLLVLIFKLSIYLAVLIGVILAVVLATAFLGKVIRLIFFKNRSNDSE
jgi:hypothetical protein